jgi:hypothetical protein
MTGIAGSFADVDTALDDMADVGTYLPPIAQETLGHLRGTASAGTTPEGKPWAPTKKGERALENAASQISVRVAGLNLVITLSEDGGHATWWHWGTRGIGPRYVIPVDIIGEKLGKAIDRGAASRFVAITNRGKRGWTATRAVA